MSIHNLTRIAAVCCLVLAMLSASTGDAMAGPDANSSTAQAYVDATKHAVPYALNARRIVSLAPNLTEMAYAAGLGDRMAGRTDFCNYPPAVLELPTVGGFVDTSLEQIIVLRPDLVLASQGNSLELVEQLRQSGITVLAFLEPVTLADILEQLETLWRVAGDAALPAPPILDQLSKNLAATTAGTSAGAAAKPRPVVFFGYPGENTLTCGKGSFLDDLIARAGGTNAAHGVNGRWPVVSAEFLVAADPDLILTATPCSGAGELAAERDKLMAELKADQVWGSLTAVRRGNVLVLDADVLLRPGPRIFAALDQLAAELEQLAGDGGDKP